MATVLVIEDEESLREGLVEILEASGFNAIAAENGAIGIDQAKQHHPDLILCDVMMPELDGFGVLNLLRQDVELATIPLVFLTAKADRSDLRQGMNLGADDYLIKPIGRVELLDSINSRLGKKNRFEQHLQKRLASLTGSITLSLPHELRTPLTGILGLSEILIEEHDAINSDDLLEIAKDLKGSADRLYRLIQNFLLYAELELTVQDDKRAQNLRGNQITPTLAIIRETAERKASHSNRNNDLYLSLEESSVQISSINLSKVIEEITDNAFKYSSVGTPVHIKSISDLDWLYISITNQGRGMTKAQIAAIGAYMQFERQFYEQQGSGLGLTIAQRIVQLHGGKLTIDSEIQQYTKVQLELPLVQTSN